MIVNFDIDENGNVINDQIPVDKIDVRRNSLSPYYDESFGGTTPTIFRDLSFVQDPFTMTNHYFYAETYLVNEVAGTTVDPLTGIVKSRVEIYSGVRWGWENTYDYSSLSSLVSTTTAQAGLELDLSTTTSNNSRSTPEASTVLGLFILSFFTIVQRFKTNSKTTI